MARASHGDSWEAAERDGRKGKGIRLRSPSKCWQRGQLPREDFLATSSQPRICPAIRHGQESFSTCTAVCLYSGVPVSGRVETQTRCHFVYDKRILRSHVLHHGCV